jgi:hypothetical protein
MSNVIRLFDCDRRSRSLTPPTDIDVHELQLLLESWNSINCSIAKLTIYLNRLRLILDALPDTPEKPDTILLLKEAEIQIAALFHSVESG